MATVQRKLTTILSADVQGYSRLMEADEEGTLARLKASRDAMASLIAAHGGRVVNTWGDGVLAEFPSVVEAVRAAIDVQTELGHRNAGVPDATRMLFRIGINLGDVIVEDGDLYGDGVNIAARLQEQAAPGGIVISRTVYDQVRNKVAVGFDFLGQLAVKNIDETIASYALRLGGDTAEPAGAAARGSGSAPGPALPPAASPPRAVPLWSTRRMGILAVAGALVVAINLITWQGIFWARWPLLVLLLIAGLDWARQTRLVERNLAVALVVGVFLTAINLSTWSGYFWAVWPLLALAAGVVLRLLSRPKAR